MVEIRILGPLEARVAGRPVNLGGHRPQTVLAALALDAGRVVTVERLVEAVWQDAPPSSARSQIAIHISALRKAFGDAQVIETAEGGYRLPSQGVRIDAQVAQELIETGEPGALKEALGLWRGPVLPGIEIQGAHRLEELRLSAIEAWVRLELAQGGHRELIGQLTSLVARYPLRERIRAQLMEALWRSGRQADALDVYREGRRLIKDELGVEPGAELKGMERVVLTEDPPAVAGAPLPVPAELPPDVTGFTGRREELARLDAELTKPGSATTPIVAISGPGGIGKSSLAVHLAHRVAGSFPDGQLYINLHGATPGIQPLDPRDVLGRFLRTLGVDDELMPKDMAEAAARFRSLTAGRRILVVLDNAADVAQIRPLLPGGDTGACLVTGRQRLSTLDGAVHADLDALSARAAVALLAQVADEARVSAEPEAAAEIAELCGFLPLALRIAGARVAARPGRTLAMLAGRLRDAKRRLDELEHADLEIRASFAVSHNALDDRQAELFALLGRFEVPDISPPVVAALAGCSTEAAQDALDGLMDAQLLQARGAEIRRPAAMNRYRMHDLIRLYAREQAPGPATAPLRRALHCYLATARRATVLLDPTTQRRTRVGARSAHAGIELADRHDAAAWLDAERDNLLAVVRLAATGCDETIPVREGAAITAGLSAALATPFSMRGWWKELISLNRMALRSVRGEPAWEAQIYNDLVTPLLCSGRVDEAVKHLDKALRVLDEAGDTAGKASVLNNLGRAQGVRRRFNEALSALRDSACLKRDLGDSSGEARALTNLGTVLQKLDRFNEALAAHERSLAIYRGIGDTRGTGIALGNAGEAHRLAGQPDRAVARFQEALRLLRASGDRYSEAVAMWGLGRALNDEGQAESARQQWHGSLAILEEVGVLQIGQAAGVLSGGTPETPEPIRVHI